MRQGHIILGREQQGRLLRLGVRFFLAAALTASQTPGGYAPFALGFASASGGGAEGAAALVGTVLGAAVFMDFYSALPFLAAVVLVFTTACAFRDSWLMERRSFLPLTGTGLFLAVAGIYVAQSLSPLRDAPLCAAAAVLVGLSAWFYGPLFQERPGPDSLLFLVGSLLLALADVEILTVSVGRSLLGLLLVYTAYERGLPAGAAAGLGAGLAADFCSGSGTVLYAAAWGLGGLLAGSRSGGRRIGASAVFWCASLLASLPVSGELRAPLLAEAGLGAVLFLLLPGRLFGGKRVKRAEPLEAPAGLERLKAQLTGAAGALRDLYESMNRVPAPATEENPAIVFDRAAEKVCRGCALCELCWQREYSGTFNALNDATPYLLERGRALAKDFPGYFSSRCIHMPDFLTAVNGELSAYLLRRQYRRQLEETRRSARGQYAQLSELLTATAAGLGETSPVSGEGNTYRIGAALRPKDGETACGDTVTAFRTESGLLCLLLADGMGSGEAARKESALTCRLLRQFLEAGIAPEAALKTLNSAMALRGADTGSFTTIDLVTCRPETGEAAVYKFGAAPSYLKKSGTVRRITGGTLPAGLRGAPAAPDVTNLTLEPGSFLVMISDGVADPARDEWLQDLLAGWSGDDPQTLANFLLSESRHRETLDDDCGIQILYLPETPVKKV